MNTKHLHTCASPEWARFVAEDLLPWVLATHELGDDLLEIGAGPGLTTDVLRQRVVKLTAVEIDASLALALARRLAATNVAVVQADGAALPFSDARFSAGAVLTMLHHVPTPRAQDRLLGEVRRVLRRGGVALGTDGLDTPRRRALHDGDTFCPIDPEGLSGRLQAAGFADITVEVLNDRFRFAAVKR